MLPKLHTPRSIQDYLDALPYNSTERTLCVRDVMAEQMAHCMDGAIFAAASLEAVGHRPLIVDLRAVNDDDHVIAVFQENGLWGAVAKSNTTLLRYRDPIYRSIRELALSYFAVYFNCDGAMSLYEYSRPYSLRKYRQSYLDDDDVAYIGVDLDDIAHYPIITRRHLRSLPPVPGYLLEACFKGADTAGLFKP